LATSWKIRRSSLGTGKSLFSKTSRPALGPTHSPIQWAPLFFPGGYSGRSVKLITHPHLVLKFRMSGAMPVILLYAIVAWADCSFNFCISFRHINQHNILHLCYGYSLKVRGSSRFCTACRMQHPDQFPIGGGDYRLMRENFESRPEVGRAGGSGG
jgi:hypothetical protein